MSVQIHTDFVLDRGRHRAYLSHLNHLGQRVLLLDENARPVDLMDELPDPREDRHFEARLNQLADRLARCIERAKR